MITLINGHVQNCSNIFVPNGSIKFQLNVDATVVANPQGFVAANLPVVFQLDSNGNILPNLPAAAAQIWSNAELNPQNSVGLGTYYLVTIYDQNGARLNMTPMWWQFTQAANSTVDISQMVPYSTIGGNVIFYPTSFTIPAPTLSSLGGVFANAGVAHEWISAINTDGSVTLSQPSFADISGTISAGQLPSPLSFGATTFTGLISAQANIALGISGTTSGQITLDGSTSGSCTITAPAIAGTSTNPIAFSNSINLPSGTVYAFNSDTGISRDSAGVIDIGNGTAGNTSGGLKLTTITVSGLITGQGNIQLGLNGTAAGVVTLEGGTSGAATITAPAVAGTDTNPIAISNSLNLPSGTVYGWNADTGLSRFAATVVYVGNGTAGDHSGALAASEYDIGPHGVSGTAQLLQSGASTVSGISGSLLAVGNDTVAIVACMDTNGDLGVAGTLNGTGMTLSSTITKYNNVSTAGNGVVAIYGATSQKSETGADANVLTFSPASGSYRVRFVLVVGSAIAATLGWTATWTDSEGNAQSPTNLALLPTGSATWALTTGSISSAGDYHGYVDIDTNGSANIVVKLTASGTFTAKVTATIEQLA